MFCDNVQSVLEYLVKGRTRRELFRLLWAQQVEGNVSALARRVGVSFSAAYRELEAMRAAGLSRAERAGTQLVYRASQEHPHAGLLRELAVVSDDTPSERREDREEDVRSWLAVVGAPLGSPPSNAAMPPLEEVLAEALTLSHRDATVARVLPLVLWRQRDQLNLDELVRQATHRDERQALGYFLELAGRLGDDANLLKASVGLSDKRRTKPRMFFAGPHGRYAAAATRKNTPEAALKWGYLMSMGLDSFRSTFDKFAHP